MGGPVWVFGRELALYKPLTDQYLPTSLRDAPRLRGTDPNPAEDFGVQGLANLHPATSRETFEPALRPRHRFGIEYRGGVLDERMVADVENTSLVYVATVGGKTDYNDRIGRIRGGIRDHNPQMLLGDVEKKECIASIHLGGRAE